jgi:pyruvate formate lyase activating enzyme
MMKQAVIFDIQRFSIHDGPGIRTTVFFKGCPLRCAWCQNPESHHPKPEIAFYKQRCTGCLTCKDACQENAVLENPDRRVDYNRCTVCSQCVSACLYEALKTVGALWGIEQLLAEIKKDTDFFFDSGGGITLSGGEPAAQSRFLKHFLPLVKNQGIHVNMETCGLFHWNEMKELLPFLDLLYYDLKLMDPHQHKKYTGQDNKIILENFKQLASAFPNLQTRIMVVPGINDSPENILSMGRFLKKCSKNSIHLLKYHHFGEAKLATIQTQLKPMGLQTGSTAYLEITRDLFAKEGIKVICME